MTLHDLLHLFKSKYGKMEDWRCVTPFSALRGARGSKAREFYKITQCSDHLWYTNPCVADPPPPLQNTPTHPLLLSKATPLPPPPTLPPPPPATYMCPVASGIPLRHEGSGRQPRVAPRPHHVHPRHPDHSHSAMAAHGFSRISATRLRGVRPGRLWDGGRALSSPADPDGAGPGVRPALLGHISAPRVRSLSHMCSAAARRSA